MPVPQLNQLSGTKTLVVCRTRSEFIEFQQGNKEGARFVFFCVTADDLRRNPRADVMFLGEFWLRPDFPSIYEIIKGKTIVNPRIVLPWFPM